MMDASAEEIEQNGGAGLPHRDQDPIMRLIAHYFGPADYMFEAFSKLDELSTTPKGLSPDKVIERRYCLMYWLSSLYVTIEGMENLPLADELKSRPLELPRLAHRVIEILADADDHRDALRLLRNGTFHFQKTPVKHLQFFDTPFRLSWAVHLHKAIERLFSDYRIQCSVICALAGRKEEIDIKRKPHPSRNVRFLGG